MSPALMTKDERDASLVFRYNPKSKNPKTSMHTIHTWSSPVQVYCQCGRFDRDNPKLTQVTREELPSVFGLLCKRCTWHDPDAERRLNKPEER